MRFSQIDTVLLVPAKGDPLGLLRAGPYGARPPMMCDRGDGNGWVHGYHGSYSPRDGVYRWGLVIAWGGVPVPEGLDRLSRAVFGKPGDWDLEVLVGQLLDGDREATADTWGAGTWVLVDAGSRALERDAVQAMRSARDEVNPEAQAFMDEAIRVQQGVEE